MTDKVSADLAGPAQTMLTTLYCKALDADLPEPILGDTFAKDTVARIDFDWASVKVTPRWTPLVTVRTALFDIWVSQFLAVHPRASVIHLGCGLDSRILRLSPGPDVEWFDVDYPPVIAMKEQLFPKRPGYHLKAVTNEDWSWLGEIPHDRPVLLLVEGVSMYLTEAEGVAMIGDVVAHFPAGEIQIDFYNGATVRSQKVHRLQRQSGSTLHWAVDRPTDVLERVPELRLLVDTNFFDASTYDRTSPGYRAARALARRIRPVRTAFQYHRYAFGPVS